MKRGGWPILPRGTNVQFRHNFNSRGAALFAFLFSAKGGGLDLTRTQGSLGMRTLKTAADSKSEARCRAEGPGATFKP